jgi:hypothetical protein
MATATRNQGKSGFVKEFLNEHPEGNAKAVNEAWQGARNKGTIGDTVFYKIKGELGLTGKLRQKKTRTSSKAKAASKSAKAESTSLGKSSFVKEFLNDHPQSNVKTVNKAWLKAGMTGTISSTLVNTMRASMGLTGNLRATTKPTPTTTGMRPGRPLKSTTAAVNQQRASSPQGRKSDRSSALLEVEAEIDRLIFTVMGIGNLPEIETVLREARRRVYKALPS